MSTGKRTGKSRRAQVDEERQTREGKLVILPVGLAHTLSHYSLRGRCIPLVPLISNYKSETTRWALAPIIPRPGSLLFIFRLFLGLLGSHHVDVSSSLLSPFPFGSLLGRFLISSVLHRRFLCQASPLCFSSSTFYNVVLRLSPQRGGLLLFPRRQSSHAFFLMVIYAIFSSVCLLKNCIFENASLIVSKVTVEKAVDTN